MTLGRSAPGAVKLRGPSLDHLVLAAAVDVAADYGKAEHPLLVVLRFGDELLRPDVPNPERLVARGHEVAARRRDDGADRAAAEEGHDARGIPGPLPEDRALRRPNGEEP